jgi:predicted kinase
VSHTDLGAVEPGTLVVLTGPAAVGKSTRAAAFVAAHPGAVICLDRIRQDISGDPGDQTVTAQAVREQNRRLDRRLWAGAVTLLDSTNIQLHVRRTALALATRHGRPTLAVLMRAPLGTCLARNGERQGSRRVPEMVLRWQHAVAASLTPARLLAEGFGAVRLLDTAATSTTIAEESRP